MIPASVTTSASAAASNRTGDAGFYFGGISTGGGSQWMLYVALGALAFLLLKRR
jgi:hypothetical protein